MRMRLLQQGQADSPHPRGWTVGVHQRAGKVDGFPAPAGMDPQHPGQLAPPAGIPRTRGDGPRSKAGELLRQWDSPHPRGWTVARAADHL